MKRIRQNRLPSSCIRWMNQSNANISTHLLIDWEVIFFLVVHRFTGCRCRASIHQVVGLHSIQTSITFCENSLCSNPKSIFWSYLTLMLDQDLCTIHEWRYSQRIQIIYNNLFIRQHFKHSEFHYTLGLDMELML